MTDRQTRVAVVTGASKGIGAAIAKRLSQDGIAVVVNYAKGREAAEAIVAALAASGSRAISVAADIGDPAGMATLFDAAERAFGGTDILVNNAGVMELSTIANVTDESFERMISVNLGGVFRCLREGAGRLRDGGRIISFSSSVVGMYQPGYGVYAAAK